MTELGRAKSTEAGWAWIVRIAKEMLDEAEAAHRRATEAVERLEKLRRKPKRKASVKP